MFPIASNSDDEKLYVNDVFSIDLLSATSVQANNNINFTKYGGMVWAKNREYQYTPTMYDTNRGGDWAYLRTDRTGADGTVAAGTGCTFNSNGFTFGGNIDSVWIGNAVAWSFRKAATFFDIQTVTHTNGTANNIDLSVLGTVGMVIAKITTTTGDWDVWHCSLTTGNNLVLNTTAAQSTTNAWLSVSGTTATLSASAPTGTYVIYAWAHDTSATGMIQCGSFTTSGGSATVNLGWEPQFLLTKSATSVNNWLIADTLRGMPNSSDTTTVLFPNSTDTEASATYQIPTATGFTIGGFPQTATCIYMAIRRPNKPPTTGTQVFSPVAANQGLNTTTPATSNITDDFFMSTVRDAAGSTQFNIGDRLRGSPFLYTQGTAAETSGFYDWAVQTGVKFLGNLTTAGNLIMYHFKRAPGFFDVVCYTGDGVTYRQINHNLKTVPQLVLIKRRNDTYNWLVNPIFLGGNNKYLYLNATDTMRSNFLWAQSTETLLGLDGFAGNDVNASSGTYVAYLFATLAGISKVGSYTGNGSSQNIECGFAAGARFVLIKCTSTTGDWYVWDTARGIVTANDPHLSLNTTAAEVTTDDSIDPYSPGFTVNQVAATNINVTSATYIFLAIS